MLKSKLISVLSGLALLAGAAAQSAPTPSQTSWDLEPAISGSVSASGLFPTQAMEEAFETYMRWVQAEGLSPLIAFEMLIEGNAGADNRLPSRRMQDQFLAYLRWVDEQGLSPFYAFTAGKKH